MAGRSNQRVYAGMIWCRRGESNPRPRDYETLALPLSYAGTEDIYATEGLHDGQGPRFEPDFSHDNRDRESAELASFCKQARHGYQRDFN
jgi:hypothetical protein